MSSINHPTSADNVVHALYWDIENCQPPRQIDAFDVVLQIRHSLGISKELHFRCFCDATKLSHPMRISLQRANVTICDVPDRKPGASDRQIIQELYRLIIDRSTISRKLHVVIISGDGDFANVISDLKSKGGFIVSVIVNEQARRELGSCANHSFKWNEICTRTSTKSASNNVMSSTSSSSGGCSKIIGKKSNSSSSSNKSGGNTTPTARTKNNTKNEINDGGEGEVFKCAECNRTFSQESSLVQHVESTQHTGLLCDSCHKGFKSDAALQQHMKSTGHVSSSLAAFATNLLIASIERKNKTKKDKDSESDDDGDDNQAYCRDCMMQFSSERALFQHLNVTGHTDEMWSCNTCNRAFDNVMSLKQHCMSVFHYNQDLWICGEGECGKYFRNQRIALLHLQKTGHSITIEPLINVQFS